MSVSTFEEPRLDIGREAPPLYRAAVALEQEIELDETIRGLVRLRASILNGCAYCVDMHTKDARAAGETEQRLYAVAAWEEAPFFSDRERAALALTDAVTLISQGHVPHDVYEAAAEEFEANELAHLIWQIASINTWNRIAISTRQRAGEYEPRGHAH
ncbi:MAG TPA: carboxymuconolactone decarboxylase family protein [Gaiellaceae bacterium]|nr:carboxymuconolactone decarboxylase family protein [Gaiellaceae bacterium]